MDRVDQIGHDGGMTLPARIVLAMLALLSADTAAPGVECNPPMRSPTATAAYQVRTLRGWTVRVHPNLRADARLHDAVMDELDHQLYAIGRTVPEAALARLRAIEIWVELETPKTQCMCYHVSKDWLVPNGYNPDKEGTVEIGNARAFVEWTRDQPWMVLHELAHGYHDKVLGYDHRAVHAAWRRSLESGVYDSVERIGGRSSRHYALENDREWFAETTEALFGTNDFFPFVRSELRRVDPEGAALVERLWREPPAATPAGARGSPPPRPGAR